MPKEVKAYSCSFGCGRRVQMSKSAVAKHEKTCAMNPERRACKACIHKSSAFLPGDDRCHVGSEPTCNIKKLPYGSLMHFNCEFFENTDA